jgi:hypothetical protein
LSPLAADNEEFNPPPDLALRTIARVAEHIVRTEVAPTRPRSAETFTLPPTQPVILPSEVIPSPSAPRTRNLVASIGLALAGLALLFPAVIHVRNQQQMLACQNNLRQFHQGLVGYSETNNNQFPQVKDDEQVLAVGRVMTDYGYLPHAVMNCPVRATSEETPPVVLTSYAYTLGYRDGHELRGLSRETQNDLMPIIADAPRRSGIESVPVNHRHGQNVLFVGGNVRFCTNSNVGVEGDNIFCNTLGEVAAGLTRWDSVLGRAEERP